MREKLGLYAQTTHKSLENAERWINDAKLLIDNSSFGHANALLRYACEELSKAFACWAISERIYPVESKISRNVFRSHKVKNRLLVGFTITAKLLIMYSKAKKSTLDYDEEPSINDFGEFAEWLNELILALEKGRQKAIYVDIDFNEKKVMTPLSMSEKKTMNILRGTEIYLKMVKHFIENFSEAKKDIFRKFTSSIPKEVWKEQFDTSKAIEWVEETYGIDLSSLLD